METKVIKLEDGTGYTLREGDLFRWYYKSTQDLFEPYHCKTCMCRWNGDVFKDLFWSMGNHYEYGYLKENDVDFTSFMGNINDFEEIREPEMEYYNEEDLLNISHSNHSKNWSGCFFVRKGANKSRERIKKEIKAKIQDKQYEIDSAKRSIERLNESLTQAEDDSYDVGNIYF